MDCSGTSPSNSGPWIFSDMGSSTVEPNSESSDTDRLMGSSTVEPKSRSLNDGSNKENKVRKRTAYSQAQLKELHTYFNQNAYLDPSQMGHISRKLGLTRGQVRKWFQNMRMKRKKQMNVSAQEFQLSKTCDLSVMNPSRNLDVAQLDVAQLDVAQPGVAQPDVAQPGITQPGVTLQQVSWTNNNTHAIQMDNQSWNYFCHLHKQQQRTAEFSTGYYYQATVVPTYSNPYLEPHAFQSNYGMDQSWSMSSRDNWQQQQNRGNYQAGLVYDHPEANSLTREYTDFTQL
ncbi:putative homeobox protein NANOG2 [Trichosurus vulpecula]|uniref:putative homeobox protein NANOG2 n=1 Tax=Trichosurus vulpecula TaxID=9337 RepID=UPI00186B4F24|nr:putative homeobox protein NANOG2 [Trichosurus vulpecula]